jgi:hypothetical protein
MLKNLLICHPEEPQATKDLCPSADGLLDSIPRSGTEILLPPARDQNDIPRVLSTLVVLLC